MPLGVQNLFHKSSLSYLSFCRSSLALSLLLCRIPFTHLHGLTFHSAGPRGSVSLGVQNSFHTFCIELPFILQVFVGAMPLGVQNSFHTFCMALPFIRQVFVGAVSLGVENSFHTSSLLPFILQVLISTVPLGVQNSFLQLHVCLLANQLLIVRRVVGSG